MLHRTKAKVVGLAACAALLSTPLAAGSLTNAGFETCDLTGWTAGGIATAVSSHAGIAPHEGSCYALLTAGTLDVGRVETALDMIEGTITSMNPAATTGSYIYQDVWLAANESITEWAYFRAEDYHPDFGFWSFAGGDWIQAGPIGDVAGVGGNGGWSGWQSFTFTAPWGYWYRIGFAVVNGFDDSFGSTVGVDAGQVPEPGSLTLVGLAGLACIGLCRRRRTSAAER